MATPTRFERATYRLEKLPADEIGKVAMGAAREIEQLIPGDYYATLSGEIENPRKEFKRLLKSLIAVLKDLPDDEIGEVGMGAVRDIEHAIPTDRLPQDQDDDTDCDSDTVTGDGLDLPADLDRRKRP